MPEWQIPAAEYLNRVELNLSEFERELHLPDVKAIKKVIPLRDIHTLTSPPIPIGNDLLLHILKRIKTLDGRQPFGMANIQLVKLDPRQVKIGQKFVYRENYQAILEGIPNLFRNYLATNGGLSDFGAYFVFGLNGTGDPALACYLPPLVERHNSGLVIMDGIHRDYIVMQTGGTLNAIIIDGVFAPFPCAPKPWSEIEVISLKDKPKDINERYFELQKGLFRDLKHLGIDG